MPKYHYFSRTIDMEGMDPEPPYGCSAWIHENLHKHQHQREGWKFILRYFLHPWRYERPAYYAQLCYLVQEDLIQDRFSWLRDILEQGYKDATPDKVEDLLDEIGL